MNAEFFDAVADIEKAKGIPREYMYEKIRQAMLTAFRKDTPDCEDNVEVILDEAKKKIEMVVKKTVVARVIDPYVEISEEAAHRISKRAKIGDVVSVPVETKQFGRIAAQAAKQVIIQGIREAERGMIYEEFNSKEHEILTGVVNKIDPRTGCAFLKISSNSDYTEAMLAPAECIRGEVLHEGDRIKVYVVEVRNSTRGPQVLISRTHPGLVKRLFELEVPEIFDGTVEIKSIAREAGSRTKMAVWAEDPVIDPIGACVGPKGGRVASVVNELGGEKIDIVKYRMLLGFLGCVGAKAIYALRGITPPVWADAFFIGIVLSVLGAVLGSALRPPTQAEQLARERLFDAPTGPDEAAACRKDRRLWRVYLVFGLCVGLFFLFFYAIPYSRAL